MAYSTSTTILSPTLDKSVTDLATVKDELSIAVNNGGSDNWLTGAIMRVSDIMGNACNRTFAPQVIRDAIDITQDAYPAQTPGGFTALELSCWPIITIQSVKQTLATGVTKLLTDGIDFRTNWESGLLERLNPFTGVVTRWEAIPVTVDFVAGFGMQIVEQHSVPSAQPYVVPVAQAATYSCDVGVVTDTGIPLTRINGAPGDGQYSVNASGYTFSAAQAGQSIDITYTVRVIPGALVDVALRLITARFKARGRDPALMQQDTRDVGTQRWWIGGTPGQKGAFPPDIASTLEFYSMPSVA